MGAESAEHELSRAANQVGEEPREDPPRTFPFDTAIDPQKYKKRKSPKWLRRKGAPGHPLRAQHPGAAFETHAPQMDPEYRRKSRSLRRLRRLGSILSRFIGTSVGAYDPTLACTSPKAQRATAGRHSQDDGESARVRS